MKADHFLAETLGTARLLTAIFFADYSLRDIFVAMGLDLCPYITQGVLCHQPNINPTYYPYCAQPHKRAHKNPAIAVALICEVCEIRFYRPLREVKGSAKKGQTHIFCGRNCFGRWMGNTHGFATHPNHIRAKASKPDHCLKGHPFNLENTYYWRSHRQCRTCTRERNRKYYVKKIQAKRKAKLTKHMREHW